MNNSHNVAQSPATLTYPLFHGTGSLFWPRIAADGLGSADPVKEMGIVPALKFVYERLVAKDPDCMSPSVRAVTEEQINQVRRTGAMTFASGDTYLATSARRAAQSAIHTRVGSEILTKLLDLWDILQELDPASASDSQLRHLDLPRLSAMPEEPVVIRIDSVPLEHLEAEGNAPVESIINGVEEAYRNHGPDGVDPVGFALDIQLKRLSFRLKGTIPPEQLVFHRVNWAGSGDDVSPFELTEFAPT